MIIPSLHIWTLSEIKNFLALAPLGYIICICVLNKMQMFIIIPICCYLLWRKCLRNIGQSFDLQCDFIGHKQLIFFTSM